MRMAGSVDLLVTMAPSALERTRAASAPASIRPFASRAAVQVPVDLRALEAAGVCYWVSNAHKWLHAPRGCAVLWVARRCQARSAPTNDGSSIPALHGPTHVQTEGERCTTRFPIPPFL